MKKLLSFLLIFVLLFSLCACGTEKEDNSVTTIKFSQTVEDLKKLENKTVEIKGFMSLLSPLNGELIYLLNIPFQSCPFCVPNTNTLSNTIAVKGKNIEFTTKPIKITGTLVFGKFSDSYGYEYNYRIENAKITPLNDEEVSKEMKVYYTLSQEGFIEETYMVMTFFDQVAFYESYNLDKTEFDSYGEIPFDKYQTIVDTVNSLNSDGEYNDFLEMVKLVEDVRTRMNKSLTNKDYDSYTTYQKDVDELFTMFYAFINKYEF